MSYQVKQGNIFGRVGEGFGKGLAEQVPQEVDRYRLKKGLSDLSKQKDLTPFEQFANLSSIPGATPQMIQSGTELLKQQGINKELIEKANQEKDNAKNAFPPPKKIVSDQASPSIATTESLEATRKPYIPPTLEEQQQMAGQKLRDNPGLYAKDPNKAFQAVQQEVQANINRSNALQSRREAEQNIQDRIKTGLDEQSKRLGAKSLVPGNVYEGIEQKAISSVLPEEEGGEGLTEEQARIKYGKDLDQIAKEYQAIKTVGGRNVLSKTPEGNKKSLEEIRKKFKERDDLDNYAKTLQAEQNISPSKSYYLAYKPSDIKELNNELVKLPELKKEKVPFSTTKQVDPALARKKTIEYAPKLFKAMGIEGSPLAIYEELNSRNYDGEAWMDYVSEHRKKLSKEQDNQLNETRGRVPTLDDAWLFYFSGLDKLVEQQ